MGGAATCDFGTLWIFLLLFFASTTYHIDFSIFFYYEEMGFSDLFKPPNCSSFMDRWLQNVLHGIMTKIY